MWYFILFISAKVGFYLLLLWLLFVLITTIITPLLLIIIMALIVIIIITKIITIIVIIMLNKEQALASPLAFSNHNLYVFPPILIILDFLTLLDNKYQCIRPGEIRQYKLEIRAPFTGLETMCSPSLWCAEISSKLWITSRWKPFKIHSLSLASKWAAWVHLQKPLQSERGHISLLQPSRISIKYYSTQSDDWSRGAISPARFLSNTAVSLQNTLISPVRVIKRRNSVEFYTYIYIAIYRCMDINR